MREGRRLSTAESLEAIKMVRDMVEKKKADFICPAILFACRRIGHIDTSGQDACDLIPELLDFKPDNKKKHDSWFENREERLRALDSLIRIYEVKGGHSRSLLRRIWEFIRK